ncbi:MAG: hypothetical protein FJ395_07440 [Verrucomicrobia bacterium]|nr:hypothetical protein [Verrucomicrobiota bacterium]
MELLDDEDGLLLLELLLVEEVLDELLLEELLCEGDVLDDELLEKLVLLELFDEEDGLVLLDDELELLLELEDELEDEESVSAVNSCVLESAREARPRTDRFAFVLRCGFRFICQLSGVDPPDSVFLDQM